MLLKKILPAGVLFFFAASAWAAAPRQEQKDKNHDGKPDQFYTFVKGRELVIKEYDRNFDGKIDRRLFTRWDASKTIPLMIGDRFTHTPNPGYEILSKEEDNDFDGTIDVYFDKKDKTKTKTGQPMDTNHA